MEQLTLFNEQLLNKEVISTNRIKNIKEQLNIQYQTLSSKEKARVLANTIHQMIDQSLPNFSKETKRRIRMELMNKKLSANSFSISANDIIEFSIELATREEIEKELPQWVLKVDIDLNKEEINIDDLLTSYQKIKSENTYSAELPVQPIIQMDGNEIIFKKSNKLLKFRPLFIGATATISILFVLFISIGHQEKELPDNTQGQSADSNRTASYKKMPNDLPPYLQYEQVDDGKLKEWLIGRNSLLAEEPYYSAIIGAANEFNIHPLLLFAITGQEQGFVSKAHVNAEKIANNPFNVYHSWEDFNTNISESSRIAARTIVNVSNGRPEEADPIQWINQKYAEDPNWWLGVSSIYKQLQKVVQ